MWHLTVISTAVRPANCQWRKSVSLFHLRLTLNVQWVKSKNKLTYFRHWRKSDCKFSRIGNKSKTENFKTKFRLDSEFYFGLLKWPTCSVAVARPALLDWQDVLWEGNSSFKAHWTDMFWEGNSSFKAHWTDMFWEGYSSFKAHWTDKPWRD